MPKFIALKKGGLSLLLWSVIPAAFIGPGTVTTCSKAGAGFGLSLLWALTFSTLATFILQEAAARITVASGKSLGEIIALKYRGRNANWLKMMLFGAVAFGCAAYQAGNILGAVSGLMLLTDVPQAVLVTGLGLLAAALLWLGSIRAIANVLAGVVFLMGIAFLVVAFQANAAPAEMLAGAVMPAFPDNSELLIIGLVGTTVVPYNLFLASGLSKGQSISEMRWGVGLAVLIGGLISMAILLTGTQVPGEFSFQNLSQALANGLGPWAEALFGIGLFAAGASSSVTAPLAAAITGQTIFGKNDEKWSHRSKPFRVVWAVVLFTGLAFGLTDVKPIPAIIAAQAINGVLLPVVAVFLLLAVNDRRLLPGKFVNKTGWNVVMGIVVLAAAGLGLYNLWRALAG
jgi:manganese transport protein